MAETSTTDQPSVTEQPGMVISPGASAPVSMSPVPATQPVPAAPITQPIITSDVQPEQVSSDLTDDGEGISWTASEYVAHHKTAGWYGLLAVAAILISGILFWIKRDIISVIFVMFGAIVMGYLANRPPRELGYRLDQYGVQIGQKQYEYNQFRSFAVVPEGAFASIVFMPLKRFGSLTTIYFAPEEEDRIIELLTPQLPLEEYKHDAIDKLLRRIRF